MNALSENLLYASSKEHMRLFLSRREGKREYYVVFHRDTMPELPKNAYGLVKVQVVYFDEQALPVEVVMEEVSVP